MGATQKMIDYATGIAELLELPKPDFTNYKDTSNFIATYCSEYKLKSRKKFDDILNGEQEAQIRTKYNKELSSIFRLQLEECYNRKGIYMFWQDSKLVYIGKSRNLSSRIVSSLEERLKSNPHINKLSIIECSTEADTHILEIVLITENKPELNKDCSCCDYSNYFKSGIIISELSPFDIFKEV